MVLKEFPFVSIGHRFGCQNERQRLRRPHETELVTVASPLRQTISSSSCPHRGLDI